MSSVVWRKKKEKKLATVIVGLFSLKENAPTKNSYLKMKVRISPWAKFGLIKNQFSFQFSKKNVVKKCQSFQDHVDLIIDIFS